jgi:hypothetical protein
VGSAVDFTNLNLAVRSTCVAVTLPGKALHKHFSLQFLFIYGILDFIYDLVLQVDNKIFYSSYVR